MAEQYVTTKIRGVTDHALHSQAQLFRTDRRNTTQVEGRRGNEILRLPASLLLIKEDKIKHTWKDSVPKHRSRGATIRFPQSLFRSRKCRGVNLARFGSC